MNKQDIINCALQLFYQKGYSETSMDDIAEELGVKKASLYYHINSKKELLYEMIESIGLKGIPELEIIVLSNQSPYEKLKDALRLHTTMVLNNVEYTALIHDEEKTLDREQREYIYSIKRKYQEFFKRIILEGIETGDFINIDVSILVNIVLGACTWPYKWFKSGGKLSSEEVAAMIYSFVMKGISK